MTVEELKKELNKYDDSLEVRVDHYGQVPLKINCSSVVTMSNNHEVKLPYLLLGYMPVAKK